MTVFLDILGIIFTSVLAENAFFTRCFTVELDDSTLSRSELKAKYLFQTGMTILAALAGWLGRLIFANYPAVPVYFSTPVSIILYIVMFLAVYAFLKYVPACRVLPEGFLERSAKNCFAFLPIGVLLVVNLGTYNWYESLIFGLGSAVGYLLALEIYLILEDRLKYARVPFFLRGLPIRLMGVGLFSLALFGLLGHSLAA